jgi:hypothetical protein
MAGSLKPILVPAALGAGGGLKVDGSGTALPVTGTITAVTAISNALPAGTNAIGKLAANSGVDIGDVDVTSCALPTGASTSAIQTANGVLISANTTAVTANGVLSGAVNETAPASDTASSGLNGRLQRVAQRLTSLIALLPAALTGSGNLKVSIEEYGSGSAAAPTTDGIGAFLATNKIMNGTTALTPMFQKIAASSSGNNTLQAAVTGKKIRVLAYNFMGAGAVNAKFQDGASGTDLTGLKYIAAAGGGICAPFNPAGWFETTANTLLNLNLSGAVAVGGEFVYVEV